MGDIVNELAERGHSCADQDAIEAMRRLQTELESTEAEAAMLRAQVAELTDRLAMKAWPAPKK